jgi:hypothetical protein
MDDAEKTKFLTLPGLELQVANRYTDYAIPAPSQQDYETLWKKSPV